ncbi:MAG TPA: ATP-binding cassette domain-containing protein [Kiritimatiellia bacterium]|nr:ATP-binding cassette domain-containing protein [Kiritimatiellia bacterium]HMO97700.1 ATP-binding cassette domain-containing protein [Kiritimatiellia bacterium]HMP95560.1 ATP-binding cassette domain-containing protein [Kiritimatiellia bacterium]
MIVASHLTKRYPGRLAVDDVSFDVGTREVVGFLGPNGSGKSTTMRMLCGYLAPTGGTARVAGYDIIRNPMDVRRRIGYLPENCPLYPEMRVDEYLDFRAALKGVPGRKRRPRREEVKALCGLTDAGRRIIGNLSKGYRQRVGLAEALIHDPELLILDEPTIGLDPNQIRQVRELIRELGRRHAILLSTHILSEVEAVCRRVVIIKDGRIAAADTTERLIHRIQGACHVHAEVRAPRADLLTALREWPEIETLEADQDGDWLRLRLRGPAGADPREKIAALAAARGWPLRELSRESGNLEDFFVSITREQREEQPGHV